MKDSKVAIVTGGASGLGLAVVKQLVNDGISVAIVDISNEQGETQEKVLKNEGMDVKFFRCDVTNQEETKQVVKKIATHFGKVDMLVNCAGMIRRTAAATLLEKELDLILSTNLQGSVHMCQAVHPYLVANGEGSIVNFASMLAHYGSKNLLSYAASKGGIVQITKCLAVEWADDNIRVNAVSPGYIKTPLSSGATQDPIFRERILSRTPQRRFGTPDEVASVVKFLLSKDASFITGVDLPIDGGLLAGDPSLYPPVTQMQMN
ncbi:SDR family oxidoreductase [Cytobacillus depressus]|uniref:SDR family oxidoreductase n=1 Tax=Cytobacillus depressus TaxID=1602942 RepID=A0A6L3V1D1_9BACI|nr:SDR family oxidoreductase [Cytobacillus depressus]KAB2329567.1 SDR family oxidoreductase [Cytobacillus depressus]